MTLTLTSPAARVVAGQGRPPVAAFVARAIDAPRVLVPLPADREGQVAALLELAREHEAATFALDLSALDDVDLEHVLASSGRFLGQLGPDERKAWHRVMATVPRFGLVWLGDIDARKAEGGSGRVAGAVDAARDVTTRFVAELERRGIPCALAPSRADGSSGWHVHAWVERADASPDLGWRLELLAIQAAKAAGVPVAHARAVHKIPEFPPEDALAWVDLAPLRPSPDAQGQPLRLPGAKRKDGGAPKGTLERAPGRVPSEVLRALRPPVPPAVHRGKAAPRELLPFSDQVGPLAQLLHRWRRPGAHHALRQALCGLAQRSKLGTRDQWLRAMASAWGDGPDATKAWASTAASIAADRPVTGCGRVRELVGSWHVLELAQVLVDQTRATLIEVHARLGLPSAKNLLDDVIPHLADDPHTPAIAPQHPRPIAETSDPAPSETGAVTKCKKKPKRMGLKKRLGHLCRHCGDVEHLTECDVCGVDRSRTRMRCGVRELCYPCLHRRARSLLDVCDEGWRKDGVYVIARLNGLASQKEARRRIKLYLRGEETPLAFVYPTSTGWSVLAVAVDPRSTAAARARGIAPWKLGSKREALDAVAFGLLARGAAVRDAAERGDPARAAALLAELYGKHEVYGRAHSPLCWPSVQDAKAEARKAMQHDDDCACPTRGLHTYTHLPTKVVILNRAQYPRTLSDIVPFLTAPGGEAFPPAPPLTRRPALARAP